MPAVFPGFRERDFEPEMQAISAFHGMLMPMDNGIFG